MTAPAVMTAPTAAACNYTRSLPLPVVYIPFLTECCDFRTPTAANGGEETGARHATAAGAPTVPAAAGGHDQTRGDRADPSPNLATSGVGATSTARTYEVSDSVSIWLWFYSRIFALCPSHCSDWPM